MYKAPPKRELSEEERITLNMGGTLAPYRGPWWHCRNRGCLGTKGCSSSATRDFRRILQEERGEQRRDDYDGYAHCRFGKGDPRDGLRREGLPSRVRDIH